MPTGLRRFHPDTESLFPHAQIKSPPLKAAYRNGGGTTQALDNWPGPVHVNLHSSGEDSLPVGDCLDELFEHTTDTLLHCPQIPSAGTLFESLE